MKCYFKRREIKLIIAYSNFKGGVGKTTTTGLFSFILTELKNKKVLAVDTDQQANLSKKLARTFDKVLDTNKTIYHALFTDNDVRSTIQTLTDNLDLLSGSWEMSKFESYSQEIFKESYHNKIIKMVLEEVKNDYDYILIDTSPATDLIKDNTIVASDYVVITANTTRDVFDSTQNFYNYLLQQYNNNDTHFELLGVLPYLIGDNKSNIEILEEYKTVFEEDLLDNHIRKSARVETWENSGIKLADYNDERTMDMYIKVVDEIINRIGAFENER